MITSRNREAIRARAAKALDETHIVGERGPRTMMRRARLAAWLDGARSDHGVMTALRWCEYIARTAAVLARNAA